jgi:hypothetical protein
MICHDSNCPGNIVRKGRCSKADCPNQESVMMYTNDGQPVTASDPKDVIRELHKMSRTPCSNDQAFMADTAGRVSTQFNKRVRTDCAKHFVADLIEIGLLVEEENTCQ